MKKLNRTCVLDKKAYYYCSSGCKDNLGKPSWMMSFCSENCKNIFEIVSRFNAGKMSLNDAKEALKKCDLSNQDHFTESTQRIIKDIFKEDDIIVTHNPEENVIAKDFKLIIDHAQEVINEPVLSESTENFNTNRYYYKKKKKMNRNNG